MWAKHYQQSPVGSTQNVKPVIFQAGIGAEFISSAAENSPSDLNAPISETFSYHDNLQPANQRAVNSATANQNEVAAQPANRNSALANLCETSVHSANRSFAQANQNEASTVAASRNSGAVANQSEVLVGHGSGYVGCHGDAENKLNQRNQLETPIERDLQAAARHRERLAMQTRLEQPIKNRKPSRCMLNKLTSVIFRGYYRGFSLMQYIPIVLKETEQCIICLISLEL